VLPGLNSLRPGCPGRASSTGSSGLSWCVISRLVSLDDQLASLRDDEVRLLIG
jgi:hypothetical protein